MNKQELRKFYLKKRKDLNAEEHESLSIKIKNQFISFLSENVRTVHIYIPILSRAEINTWPIIHELWKKNIQVAVPVMDWGDYMLRSCQLAPDSQLKENTWGVPEPVIGVLIENELIDAIVTPLLAFDQQGFRIGYGKGFYDKYLNSIQHKPVKIGLSYFPPVEEISAPDPWDVPLDFCITPDQVITF